MKHWLPWNNDQCAELARRFEAGESPRQIAVHLGTTKNSIIGKARRLGFGPWNHRRPVTLRNQEVNKEKQHKRQAAVAKKAELKIAPKPAVPRPVTNRPLSKSELRELFEQAWANTTKLEEAS